GTVQTLLRQTIWAGTARDYWYPDIRSTEGAGIVLSAVLYPYVYLTTRVVFLMQGRNLADVARTLGAGRLRVFFRVLLPVARPAIAAGIALALMETLNDIGAAEFLGVRTLTMAVYTTWLNRGSIEGAAQIAVAMLAIVFLLMALEQQARRRQRFHQARVHQLGEPPLRRQLKGAPAMLALLATALPVLFGFGIPVRILVGYAWARPEQIAEPALASAFANSLVTASAAAILTVALALVLLNGARLSRSGLQTALAR